MKTARALLIPAVALFALAGCAADANQQGTTTTTNEQTSEVAATPTTMTDDEALTLAVDTYEQMLTALVTASLNKSDLDGSLEAQVTGELSERFAFLFDGTPGPPITVTGNMNVTNATLFSHVVEGTTVTIEAGGCADNFGISITAADGGGMLEPDRQSAKFTVTNAGGTFKVSKSDPSSEPNFCA
ncbi:hypothetical protein EG850_04525 [Gulosibacter macacae]|uniref:Lipoprotein n=1 Tax=Gulosibacter macacae TaxID=2488791 RepID=A0A3P3VXP7_9MICO|nr:hypothetical protein [Gulosibacter macacae]RRJ87572.1 hypothetical protein EG850_04525 [Gulosibacter macacae]